MTDDPLTHPTASGKLMPALLALLMAGCTPLVPDTPQPPLPVPNTWPADTGQAAITAAAGQDVALPAWQDYFTDPTLQQLIDIALKSNRDLRIAVLRIEEARAAYGIQRADLYPGVSVGGQGGRARTPGDLNPSGQSVVGGNYEAYVGLNSWEVDLWGRVRSLSDAALAEYLATEATQRAVQLSLVTEVAHAWLGLRDLDERAALARETAASREKSYRIFQRRNDVGAASALDLTQVETLLIQARALSAELEQARAAQAHALTLLLGAPADPALTTPVRWDDALAFPPIRAGLPADLLLRRPDIMAAEQRLSAAQANIGAARAAFLPRISLTGNWGTASAELDGLFDAGSRAWSFLPTISLPIFDGGRLRANLDLAEVRSDIAVAQYEKTIQTAFREVADALSAHQWLAERLAIQREALEVQTRRAHLAQLRYDRGAASYLEVLDAQRDLLTAQQQLAQVRSSLLDSHVTLYAALGGDAATAQSASVTPGTTPTSTATP